VLIATPEKRILYMSETYEGTVHDKRIADEEALDFGTMTSGTTSGTTSGFGSFGKEIPEQVRTLLQDLGFQGYAPEGVSVVQPMCNPKRSHAERLSRRNRRQPTGTFLGSVWWSSTPSEA